MKTSTGWIKHFKVNATKTRINWLLQPTATQEQIAAILPSLQAWQLGETSDGENLIRAATKYAKRVGDPLYVDCIKLFIKEEQKHGENLGQYLDRIGKPRIQHNWGDTLFREIRHLNTSMEMWTLAVITVESAAQVFYQALKDATQCKLLQQICTDILIDEAYHISFQTERMAILFSQKTAIERWVYRSFYKGFFFSTAMLIWFAHKKLFRAGGNTLKSYLRKMHYKYLMTIGRTTNPLGTQLAYYKSSI
ncbi:ferritin-like domain-containing protein [Mucilaginibacter robiniae]|uniref:Ferritin-like domain-containing protein n=1 Tax=Mucilaginibacter robiniae TaxID=2728022 RepID=A0A7L5E4Z4_9SPHI|nr:ferritin-like domain-containing protein [Mucilaginibacter robiniae]QJD98111.1 ferritin-like domain-containing protein [Mucilaginibacter robiniae]